MIHPIHDTALLLFSRTAKQEAYQKNFFSKNIYGQNEKLAQRFIDRTHKLARQTKLPFFTIDEKQQRGESFGERLSNAMGDIFEKGFRQIVVIGNDCPLMSTALINQAVDELRKSDLILAPTRKGGVYLLGVSKEKFEHIFFKKIQWQTSLVFEELCKYVEEKKLLSHHLACLDDVNDYADLLNALNDLSIPGSLRFYIISLLASDKFLKAYKVVRLPQSAITFKSLRGPPSLAMLA